MTMRNYYYEDPDLVHHSRNQRRRVPELPTIWRYSNLPFYLSSVTRTRFQKTFDDWVIKNIQVRECHKFVKKKDDDDNDPICHCRNKLSIHPRHKPEFKEMVDESTWKQEENTMLTKNNAFGKIVFDVEECVDEAQYMRIAKDYSKKERIDVLRKLFQEFWKLGEPDLLISVSGGAKSFNVPQNICASFQQGLLNAAKSTNAWIITGGQNCGVMRLVGGVIGRSISTTRIPTIGVGNWGKTWKNSLLTHANKGHGGQREAVQYPIEPPDKGFATLDPNHTHHFLVDDGTTGTDGIEYEFRGALETLICDIFNKHNVPLPMVCIMVEGGMRSLEIAISTLRKGNTLVVLKGSGRASDILCFGFENSVAVDPDKRERTLSAEAEAEIRRLIDKDFGKYKIEQDMLDLILEISTFRDFVTIYSIQNPEPLDFYILSSLMKSSANANVLAATKMRQMRLAITWGHAKIAREFIFSQKLYKFSSSELDQLMLFAITKQRTDFVKLLMDYGCDLKQFLTANNLRILYNSLDRKSGGYRLLMEKVERRKRKKEGRSKYGRGSVEEGARNIDQIQLPDVGSLLARIMQGSYKSIFNSEKSKFENPKQTFDNPFDLMTVYCALDNCQKMALLFWQKSKTPIATGLVVHRIYNYLDMMESKWARMDEEMTEQLEKAAHDFEMLSYGLMTNCYHNYEKKEWVNILEVKMQEWGNLSLFEVAQITSAKNFLSHAAYQSYLTDIWMGEVHPSTPFFLLVVCAFIPPLPIFLKYNSKNGKKITETSNDKSSPEKDDQLVEKNPNILKRLQFFYTSPAVKFILNGITYLMFLGLYICGLLESNTCDNGSAEGAKNGMIGWTDYYLIIFVSSTIPIEISQVIDGNTKSILKKFKIYFKQMYNVVDLLAIIVFTLGFGLKIAVSCDENDRFLLYEFSNYHYYRILSAFCFILYSLRFIQMFEMNAKIGPKIFMLKRMTVDLFFFLFLLGVFTFSYCVASEALLYPFHNRPVNETIFAAFRRSYFNVFGDLDIEGIGDKLVSGHCNEKSWTYLKYRTYMTENNYMNYTNNYEAFKDLLKNNNQEIYETPYCDPTNASNVLSPLDLIKDSSVGITNYYICFCLLCIYVLTVNIMLINLLIAIFSNTYADSKAKSGIIYKTQRASVIVEFEERPWLPNPLSLIYFFFIVPYKLVRRCCKHKTRHGSLKRKHGRSNSDTKNPRRAQLIEAECMVLHLKKELGKKDGLLVIESQNKKISMTVERISNELKQLTLKQTRENLGLLLTKSRNKGLFGAVTQAVEREHHKAPSDSCHHSPQPPSSPQPAQRGTHRTLPPQKYSLSSTAYEKHGVVRASVPKDCIDWDVQFDFYDPPEFTDESWMDDPLYPDDIEFNIDNGNVNRESYWRSYLVDGPDPLNVRGRTGLKGRGLLPRWGPNHFAITIITRWYRAGTGKQVYTKTRPVIEVLLYKDKNDPSTFRLPSVRLDKKDPLRIHTQMHLRKTCYGSENIFTNDKQQQGGNSAGSGASLKTRFSMKRLQDAVLLANTEDPEMKSAFDAAVPIYKGYFDDVLNTDNAWKEVDVANVHFDSPLAQRNFEVDKEREAEVSWERLDTKFKIPNNEAWLLKKTCHLKKAYNPYSGECFWS